MTELRDNLERISLANPTNPATYGMKVADWIVTATQEIERLQARVNKLEYYVEKLDDAH